MNDLPELKKYVPALVWYRPFEPFGYAVIRFGAGFELAMHGAQRLFRGANTAELGSFFASASPSLVGTVEVIGGMSLALGLLTRPLALLFAVEWLMVAFHAHVPPDRSWFTLGATEHYPALMVILCLAFLARGGGQWSLDRAIGKEI